MELLKRMFTTEIFFGFLFIVLAWNESDKYLQMGNTIIALGLFITNSILNEIRKLGK